MCGWVVILGHLSRIPSTYATHMISVPSRLHKIRETQNVAHHAKAKLLLVENVFFIPGISL